MKKKQQEVKYSKTKFVATFAVATLLFASIRIIFDIKVPLLSMDGNRNNIAMSRNPENITEVYVGNEAEEPYEISPYDTVTPPVDILTDSEQETLMVEEESMSEDDTETSEEETGENEQSEETTESGKTGGEPKPQNIQKRKPHRIKGVPSWDKCFPDINDVQLVAARHNGVTPPANRDIADELVRQKKLVNITNSPYYTVDDLTHSMPYLVPKAQQLLNTICLNFIDSLDVKGLPLHLPMITSVLRTTADVSRLQKGNGNATTHSCHCYGTTVDISYNRFVPVIGKYDKSSPLLRWDFKMKQVLAEVLDDLRNEGKCYVKYERKQGCFHLTVR